MGVEKITSKIISEAENAAESLLKESERNCQKLLSEAQKRAQDTIGAAEKESLAEKNKIVRRSVSVAEIDGKKILLEAKQKLINECFDAAAARILDMDKERYMDFLVDIVRESGSDSGELVMNKADSEKLGNDLAEKLNKEIPGGEFTVSAEKAKIKGGLLLKSGSVYVNGSLETLLEEKYNELTSEVAAMLFEE